MTARILTWALLCASLAVCACPGSRRTPVAPPTEAPENACIPLVERCEASGLDADCDGALACVGLWERAGLEYSWRRELEAVAGVDAAVSAGRLADSQARVTELEAQRWYWLGGGGAAAAAVTAILCLVVGR